MKKPEELVTLLAELKEEIRTPSASYFPTARLVVYIGKGFLTISAVDAIFLLHSPDTVIRFYDALGSPEDSGVELHEFEIDETVKSALEAQFSTVDEM